MENQALRGAVNAQAERSCLVVHLAHIPPSSPYTEQPTAFPAQTTKVMFGVLASSRSLFSSCPVGASIWAPRPQVVRAIR